MYLSAEITTAPADLETRGLVNIACPFIVLAPKCIHLIKRNKLVHVVLLQEFLKAYLTAFIKDFSYTLSVHHQFRTILNPSSISRYTKGDILLK